MVKMKLSSQVLAVLVLAVAGPIASQAFEIRPMVKLGAEFGGDTLVTVNVTGGSSSTKSIKAGQGVFLGGGVSVLNDARDIETEVSISYKFSSINANNGDIDFSVFPLDALVFYRMPHVRLGGGLTYHMSPTLQGSGAAGGLEADYDNALGVVLQGDYTFVRRFAVGLRFTHVNYKANSVRTNPTLAATTPPSSAKTDSLGVVFSVRF